jgi:hypothetical protein
LGRLLALPTNNSLGWKGLPGANTLAYYVFVTYGRKKFIALTLGVYSQHFFITYECAQ